MNKFLSLFFVFLLSGCVLQKDEMKMEESKDINFNQFVDEYFGVYRKEFKETPYKPEAYLKIFFIDKNTMNRDIDEIFRKLSSGGWNLRDKAKGYYSFCNGTKYSVSVVIPQTEKVMQSDGYPVIYHDFNKAEVIFGYNKYGIFSCF